MPAERTSDGWRIQAEAEWVVEGSAADLDEVCRALPPRCRDRSGSVLLLNLGNAVGRLRGGPLGVITAVSGKWDEAAFDRMLDDVVAEATALPFAAGAATSLAYERDPNETDADVPYHALLFLRHALLDAPGRPLLGALRDITLDPHRRMTRTEVTVPVELASGVDHRVLEDVLRGRWPFMAVDAPLGLGEAAVLPVRVSEVQARESLDTAENRFVKAFLAACGRVVATVRRRAERGHEAAVAGIVSICDEVDGALRPITGAAMWREIGVLAHMPTGSVVLQRRRAYREVLRANTLLRGSTSRLPLSDTEAIHLLEVKDIAALYELWCGLHLLGLLRRAIGEPQNLVPAERDELGVNVRRSLRAQWASGVELGINMTYTQSVGFHGRSMSVDVRPDFALFVGQGGGQGLHFLDAKFRLDRGRAERDDIVKMHAYRDAVPAARSSWVMYPGEKCERYVDAEGDGVGAFPAAPGRESVGLARWLERLVGRV